jgi:alcohol dehydrogenase (cytochrome c)
MLNPKCRVMNVAAAVLCSGLAVAAPTASAQAENAGKKTFETYCVRCHGGDGRGGEMGPPIVARLATLKDDQLVAFIRAGRPEKGMPPSPIGDSEMTALVKYLRTIERRDAPPPAPRATVRTTAGATLDGEVLGQGLDDLQLRTADGRVHLLRRDDGDRMREVTSDVDWPAYNGDPRGNRYTTMTTIDKTNVDRLSLTWLTPIPGAGQLQVTPAVVGGIMYVAGINECFALDAGTGRQIWHYSRPRTPELSVGGSANRGVDVAGDRVFMETDNAHIIALNRFTGELLWDTELADWRKNYSASSAPLAAGDLIISGVAGGEHGANGFVAAHEQATGKEVWRFATVPRRGEPGSETWKGKDIDHGGAPTWFTGSYDPELDIVYWPAGNPSKEYNGDDRGGDNLYSDSILALDRKTGRLKWYFQFTPHDLWDWDATETSVLVDADWLGQPRKLMLHADRNGFFYVFDRRDGTLLLAKPFITQLTWAKGLDAKGRPIRNPKMEPTEQGTKVCPSQDGATNWPSPSFDPASGLYFVQTFEKCSVYLKTDSGEWQPGKSYLGGSQKTADDPQPARVLKAIDIRTGNIRWTLPQPGPAYSWGGTLATASGLVFVASEDGALLAVDGGTGKRLWSFPTNQTWRASPMTYRFDGRQFIAIAAGANILAFSAQGAQPGPHDGGRPHVLVKPTNDFQVSGTGDNAAWQKVDWIPLQRREPSAHQYDTRFKTLYSSTGVYFLIDGTDRELTATMNEDFMDLWNEDVFEVFLWTDERYPVYFEYEISPLNHELPILIPNFGGKFLGWRPWHYEKDRLTRKATSVTGGTKQPHAAIQGWRAEVFIPYALLTPLQQVPPKPGTRWRANVYRMDHDGGKRTQWEWSPVGGNFHEFEHFGDLIFSDR